MSGFMSNAGPEEMGRRSACISHRPVEPGVLRFNFGVSLYSHVSGTPREGLAADQAAKAPPVCPHGALGTQQQKALHWGKWTRGKP
jgi:hypothetical protein